MQTGRAATTDAMQLGPDTLAELPLSVVLTDPNRPDNPVVYINHAFEDLTGYSLAQSIGRNCRFMQNDDRDQPAIVDLAHAIRMRSAITCSLTNFRENGTSFTNRLRVSPVHDRQGRLWAFLGVQSEVELHRPGAAPLATLDARLADMEARVKRHLGKLDALIGAPVENGPDGGLHTRIFGRIEALAPLYDEFHPPPPQIAPTRDLIAAGSYLHRLAAVLDGLEGGTSPRVDVVADPIYMPSRRAAWMGLLLCELLSPLLARIPGRILLSLRRSEAGARLLIEAPATVSVDRLQTDPTRAGVVRDLAARLQATMGQTTGPAGHRVTLDFATPDGPRVSRN